jgi:hypothetical protein
MKKKVLLSICIGLLASLIGVPSANALNIAVSPLSTASVSFSWSMSGDTITLNENWTSSGELFLVFSGETTLQRYKIVKEKVNNTAEPWISFEEELMQPVFDSLVAIIGWQGSNDMDQLDFAQGSGLPRTSDKFASVYVDENASRDFLQFYNGVVAITEADIQSFYVDMPFQGDPDGTGPPFALREEANVKVIPIPATVYLLGSTLLGLGGWRRFRKG